jgi:hypothetical protein
MMAREQDHVVQGCRAAIGPVPHVMGVAVRRGASAPRVDAAAIAHAQGLELSGRREPRGSADIHREPAAAEAVGADRARPARLARGWHELGQHRGELGVAGPSASHGGGDRERRPRQRHDADPLAQSGFVHHDRQVRPLAAHLRKVAGVQDALRDVEQRVGPQLWRAASVGLAGARHQRLQGRAQQLRRLDVEHAVEIAAIADDRQRHTPTLVGIVERLFGSFWVDECVDAIRRPSHYRRLGLSRQWDEDRLGRDGVLDSHLVDHGGDRAHVLGRDRAPGQLVACRREVVAKSASRAGQMRGHARRHQGAVLQPALGRAMARGRGNIGRVERGDGIENGGVLGVLVANQAA